MDRRPTRRTWLTRCLPALLLALAACAGPTGQAPAGDAGAGTGALAAAPLDATPPPPADAPLVVASDLDNMPFAGVDAQGRPVGRDVEMMEALAQGLGRRLTWKRIPFETLLPSAQAGLVDVVCATVGITPERAERVAFGEPYFDTTIEVVVRAGPGEPRRWADLDGLRVAAGLGTTSARAVERVLPQAVPVLENKQGLSAAERLLMGEVDGVAMDGPNAAALVAESNGTLALLETHLAAERYALVFPPGHDALREAFDQALATLMRDGSLARLDQRWGLAD